MDVAITGSSGLIGTALANALHARGDRVVPVLRGSGLGLRWDPAAGVIDAAGFEGLDAVVHLAGEGIGEKKWTDEQKRKIRDSRVLGTELLAGALAGLTRPPAVFVSGSAIGWYGNRGDERLRESSAPGPKDDFLAGVCVEWEAAASAASDAGIRTVLLRTGIVLSADGGALARMLTPFKLGLGGRIGTGRQYMSWISLADQVGAILHAVDTASSSGPVNATAPAPVTNAEFTAALGRLLHRPTKLPTPLLPLKIVFGAEMVQSLLVNGACVLPEQLQSSGYAFAHPNVDEALTAIVASAR